MTRPKPVRSKRDYYRRWLAGEFGNRPKAWDKDPGIRPIVVRYKDPGSPWCFYNLNSIKPALAQIAREGGDLSRVCFNECLPDNKILIQGEVGWVNGELYLDWSTVKKPMRLALAEERRRSQGYVVRRIIEHYAWPQDADDLLDLVYRYERHIVEFGCYRVAVGEKPGSNTLIWEVRAY